MIKLNRYSTMFRAPLKKAMSFAIEKPPASLDVHVWHAGQVLNDSVVTFQRIAQKQVVFNTAVDDATIKISHAACELKIDFKHPGTPERFTDIAKSMLVQSEEYELRKKGHILTISDRDIILKKYQKLPLHSMHLYLSWYPTSPRNDQKIMGIIPLEKLVEIERRLIENKNGGDAWIQFILGKHIPTLYSKDQDFLPQHLANL